MGILAVEIRGGEAIAVAKSTDASPGTDIMFTFLKSANPE
jgi:hypothetical protein